MILVPESPGSKMQAVAVVLSSLVPAIMSYFADWSMLARDKQPTCVDIPANMTLCHNIGEITITHQHDGSLSAT